MLTGSTLIAAERDALAAKVKEQADEIERLREHHKKMHIAVGYAADLLKDGFINEALDALEESYAIALQQKDSE